MRTNTAQQLADYFAKQVMMGRGQWTVKLDPRDGDGFVATPPAGKQLDEGNNLIFVSLRIKGVHDAKQ